MKPVLRRHHGSFRYKEDTIHYVFWSYVTTSQKPDTVILLGAGQTGVISQMVAKRAGSSVVVVSGVPHWHANPDTKDVENFTMVYFENVYRQVLATFSLPAMHVLAESQAAPVAILLAGKLKIEIKNVALIRPLGFSVKNFGDTAVARLKTFRKRIRRTLLQFPQSFLYDPRNITVTLVMIRAMLREPSLSSLHTKYGIGISYDSLHDFELAAKVRHDTGHTMSIILGEKDKLFPPKEVIPLLQNLHIPYVHVVVLPSVSHSPLATRAGVPVLKTALETVRL
jgi:pimeloyl-ACP methyl ester carboxylesterase